MVHDQHMTTPELIGSRKACELLGIDRSTLTRWVDAGKLTPQMKLDGIRGPMLFSLDAIKRLATERASSP